GFGNQDLATVGQLGHPGRPVDVQSNQTGRRANCLAAVQSHSYPNVLSHRPVVGAQGALHLKHRGGTLSRGGKDREESISCGQYFFSAMRSERSANDGVMVAQYAGEYVLSHASQQGGRSLDIGEEEGQRFRGPSV